MQRKAYAKHPINHESQHKPFLEYAQHLLRRRRRGRRRQKLDVTISVDQEICVDQERDGHRAKQEAEREEKGNRSLLEGEDLDGLGAEEWVFEEMSSVVRVVYEHG